MTKQPAYKPTEKFEMPSALPSGGGSSLSRELSSLVNQIDRTRQQDINFGLQQEAKEAGSLLDFKSSKPVTRADVLYQRRALQANQVAINNNIREEAITLRDALTKPGVLSASSGEKFHAAMEDYKADLLLKIPEENRAYAAMKADFYTASFGEMVNRRAEAFSKNQMQFQLYRFLDGSMQDASAKALQGGLNTITAAALYGEQYRKVTTAVNAGLLSALQGEQILKHNQAQLQSFGVMGEFRNQLQAGKGAEALQEFAANPPTDMSVENYLSTFSEMRGMLSTLQSAQKANAEASQEQMLQLFQQIAQDNVSPDDPIISTMMGNVEQNQGQAGVEKFQAGLSKANLSRANGLATRFMSPQTAQTAFNGVLKTFDSSSPDYGVKVEYLNSIKAAQDKNYQNFVNDRAGYVLTHPAVQEAISQRRDMPNDMGLLASPEILSRMVAIQKDMGAVNISQIAGQPEISVMTNDSAKLVAEKISTETPQERIATLLQIADKFGQYAPIAFRDLKRQGLQVADLMRLSLNENMPSETLNAVNSASLTKAQIDSAIEKPVRDRIDSKLNAAMSDYIDSVMNGSQPAFQDIQDTTDTVKKLAYLKVMQGKSTDAAVKEAYQAYVGSMWNFSSINGRGTVRSPTDISVANVRLAAQKMEEKFIRPDSTYMMAVDKMTPNDLKETVQESHYLAIKNQGEWVTTPDNSGIMLTDGFGTPVIVKQNGINTRIEVRFEDLKDPNSPIASNVAEAKAEIKEAYDKVYARYQVKL